MKYPAPTYYVNVSGMDYETIQCIDQQRLWEWQFNKRVIGLMWRSNWFTLKLKEKNNARK